MLLRTRSSELGVFYFFENLRTQNEKHDLKGPHVALAFVAFSREVVEKFEQFLATFCQLVVWTSLYLGELLRIVVHPVPYRLQKIR